MKITHQWLTFIAIVFLIFLNNCSSSVSENDMKKDLIGKEIYYFGPGHVSMTWTFAEGEIDEFKIIKRLTDSKKGTDIIEVYIKACDKKAKDKATISGTLTLNYNKYDQGWIFQGISNTDFETIWVDPRK